MAMTKELNKQFRFMFKFSFFMLVVGLVLGVYSREVTRSLQSSLSMEQFLFAQNWIVMTHGHAMFYGGVIPLVLISLTYIYRDHFRGDGRALKKLRTAFIVYMVGALMTIALSTYKGSAYVFALIQDPLLSLDAINQSLFGGSTIIRELAFTIAHPTFAVGLIWYLAIVWKKTKED